MKQEEYTVNDVIPKCPHCGHKIPIPDFIGEAYTCTNCHRRWLCIEVEISRIFKIEKVE